MLELGVSRGGTLLFIGPSGSGKTLAAELIVAHLRLGVYQIDLATLVSKYISETEKNLSRVFADAERSGTILFFDEADAVFGERSEMNDGHERYADIDVSYLPRRLSDDCGFREMLVAAARWSYDWVA